MNLGEFGARKRRRRSKRSSGKVCRCQTRKGKFTKCRKGMKRVCYSPRRRRRSR